jgi:hypothetical protein
MKYASTLLLALACATCSPVEAEQQRVFQAPPREAFVPLHSVLRARCGTLDCHGSAWRNFRVYGENGLRLAPDARLDEAVTTPDEIDQTYASTVSLEPELLETVFSQGGDRPERLTIVRKARGTEIHEGRGQAVEGSDADRCLIAWLAGEIDADACTRGAALVRPEP